jgi:FtsZ-interacting cell division protein YlmF
MFFRQEFYGKQHWAHKTQKDDNQSKGTTQQTEWKVNNRESRDTGNIEHKTERRQTKQKHNTTNNVILQQRLCFLDRSSMVIVERRCWCVLCAQCCFYHWIVYY